MFQVRFHGRGGQGVVTAAELLAEAAFREGAGPAASPGTGRRTPAAAEALPTQQAHAKAA